MKKKILIIIAAIVLLAAEGTFILWHNSENTATPEETNAAEATDQPMASESIPGTETQQETVAITMPIDYFDVVDETELNLPSEENAFSPTGSSAVNSTESTNPKKDPAENVGTQAAPSDAEESSVPSEANGGLDENELPIDFFD